MNTIQATATTVFSRCLSKYRGVIFVLSVFVLEFFLFKREVFNAVQNFYPQYFDQASFLTYFYRTYEAVKQDGIITGFLNSPPLPMGMLFSAQPIFVFMLLGASRFSVLFINFIYFIGLQLSCFLTARSFSGKTSFGFLFLGILFCVNTPFYKAGGLFDARMDLLALCAYGMFICSVITSRFYLSRKWSILSALLASLTILLRTITATYFFGIIFCLFFYFIYRNFQDRQKKNSRIKNQLVNLILSSSIIGFITFPLIWANRTGLYFYYVFGHVIGDEKYVRALERGIHTVWEGIVYYPLDFLSNHFGAVALYFCIFSLLVLFCLYRIRYKRMSLSVVPIDLETWRIGFIFLLISIFVPLVILTLDVSKSPIVVGILIVPFIWFFFWGYTYMALRVGLTEKWSIILAGVIFSAGFINMMNHFLVHHNKNELRDFSVITKMYLDIGHYVEKHYDVKQYPPPAIAVDRIQDYLTACGIGILYYEKYGRWINIITDNRLGGTIFSIKKETALTWLPQIQIIIMNLNNNYPPSVYPYDQAILPLRGLMKHYAEKHLRILGNYKFKEAVYRVYVQ